MLTIQAPKAGTAPVKKALSKTELNAIDARLLLAIVSHDNLALDAALLEGANVNAIGVVWEYGDGPSESSPLNLAVGTGNLYAVKKLIHGGANLYTRSSTGADPITDAISMGDNKIVQAILNEDPSQINAIYESTDHTLLHRALFAISSYSLIADGDWGSPAIQGKAKEFYRCKLENMPSVPSVVTYTGNLNLVNVLLRFNPKLATTKNASGVTPLDVVTNPRKFVAEFFDSNGDETIKCLTPESDRNSHILTFNVTMTDQCGNNPFTINVKFDFTKLRERLNEEARVELVETKLKHEAGRIDAVRDVTNAALKEKVKKIETGCVQDLIVYNNVGKHLANMAKIYVIASTGTFTRDQQTLGEMAGSVLSFVGLNLPSPLGAAFSICGTVVKAVASAHEQVRFKKIEAILPFDDEISDLARDVGISAVEAVNSYFANRNITITQFTEKEVTELSKRILITAVHTLYDVDKLGIKDPSTIPPSIRAKMIKAKIVETVLGSKYVMEALHSMQIHAAERMLKQSATMVFVDSRVVSFSNGHILDGKKPEGKGVAKVCEITDQKALAAALAKEKAGIHGTSDGAVLVTCGDGTPSKDGKCVIM